MAHTPPLTAGIIREKVIGFRSALTQRQQPGNLHVSAASKETLQGYSHGAALDMG